MLYSVVRKHLLSKTLEMLPSACPEELSRTIDMNKIKDFIYDKNDLLIALLIVMAATFIIMSRIDVIITYPSTLAAEIDNSGPVIPIEPDDGSGEDPVDDEDPADNDPDGEEDPADNEGTSGDPQPPSDTDDPEPDNGSGGTSGQTPGGSEVAINIPPGSNGSDIAQLLVNAGLIDRREVFYDAVSAAGAETRLQAGTFRIPANATPAEIVRIITR